MLRQRNSNKRAIVIGGTLRNSVPIFYACYEYNKFKIMTLLSD